VIIFYFHKNIYLSVKNFQSWESNGMYKKNTTLHRFPAKKAIWRWWAGGVT
jgi:hypothetical protein